VPARSRPCKDEFALDAVPTEHYAANSAILRRGSSGVGAGTLPGRWEVPKEVLCSAYVPHFCLGVARVQMRALFAEVLTRMGHLEYNGKPEYLRSNFQRGVKRLPIRWSRPPRSVR
jgi:hypothetical protein